MYRLDSHTGTGATDREEIHMDVSRRRLLGMMGAGAAGVVGAQLAGAAPAAASSHGQLDPPEFRTRLTDRYGMTYPIVQAGFSALYVTPELTAAVSNAGGLGCLGAAPEPAEGVRNLIRRTKALTSRPFGMDFVYFPMGGVTVWSPGYEEDPEHRTREITWSCTDAHIDACIEEQIAYVVFFWTPPEARWVKRLKEAGVEVWAQIGSLRGAQEAVDWGAEVIIAQGMQAGGHNRGYMDGEPSLRQELVPWVRDAVPAEVIVLGAGGVADGRTLAAALREGAEAAWVGTIFAAAEESYAHDDYKRRVVEVKNGWVETRENQLFGPEWPHATPGPSSTG
ncbi:MAG TPA: nitronate monooxygenase [Acidimicrobiia bacterium]|nr:nitronate monooxygenase [Acidimicrobiia bacterium]